MLIPRWLASVTALPANMVCAFVFLHELPTAIYFCVCVVICAFCEAAGGRFFDVDKRDPKYICIFCQRMQDPTAKCSFCNQHTPKAALLLRCKMCTSGSFPFHWIITYVVRAQFLIWRVQHSARSTRRCVACCKVLSARIIRVLAKNASML